MRERARPPYFSRAKPARNFRAALHQSSHGFATRVHGFATKTKALAHEIPPATQAKSERSDWFSWSGFRHTDCFHGNGQRLCIFCFRKPANAKQAWPECHIYSLRHRKCGVRGFIHELFVSKTRTSEVRASEGF